MIRTFAAIALPEDIRARLEVLQHMLPLPRRIAPENFHITLVFMGDLAEDQLADVDAAFRGLRAPAFELRLSGVGLFGGNRPRNVWAGVAPEPRLDHLQRKVFNAASGAGVELGARRFTPHVTLAHLNPAKVDLVRLEGAIVAESGFETDPFTVREFTLFSSRRSGNGMVYEPLESYPLEPIAD